jgi:hypothetical protein
MDGLNSRSTVIRGRKGLCRDTKIHLSSQWQPRLFQSKHFNTNAFPQSHRDLILYSLDVQIAIHPVVFPFSHLCKALRFDVFIAHFVVVESREKTCFWPGRVLGRDIGYYREPNIPRPRLAGVESQKPITQA